MRSIVTVSIMPGTVKQLTRISLIVGAIGVLCCLLTFITLRQRDKRRQQVALNDLKGVAILLLTYAQSHQGVLPANLEDVVPEAKARGWLAPDFPAERLFIDKINGAPFNYVGAGWNLGEHRDDIILYSSEAYGSRNVVFGDGHAQVLTSAQFAEAIKHHY